LHQWSKATVLPAACSGPTIPQAARVSPTHHQLQQWQQQQPQSQLGPKLPGHKQWHQQWHQQLHTPLRASTLLITQMLLEGCCNRVAGALRRQQQLQQHLLLEESGVAAAGLG
jgi:hypothetical protein